MQLEIHHLSIYAYEDPVFLEPQHLYFRPQHRSYLKLLNFQFDIFPQPSILSERLDAENNSYYQLWYDGNVSKVEINARMKLELSPFNPFDFLEEEEGKKMEVQFLTLYLTKEQISTNLIEWFSQIHNQSDRLITFLSTICDKIHQDWDHQVRYENTLLSPGDCFLGKKGSCRDLSWMLIQALRHLNIPARFVSGYSFNPDLGEGHELHAWVEAYVYGAGWVGLDPSSGLFVTNHYIPVATSHHPFNTLPVQGTYRGDAKSSLETSVHIKLLSNE